MTKLSLHLVRAVIMVGAILPPAFADVMISFTGLPGNHENGTYNGFGSGNIDGTPFNNLICDDHHHTTYVPSSLDYRVSSLNSLTYARFVANTGHPTDAEIFNYETAAILLDDMIHDSGHPAEYQYALWHLFSPDVAAYGNSTDLLLTAESQVADQSQSGDHSNIYSRLLIYTPGDGVSSQEFLQLDAVPEPSSLIMMGTVLLLIGAFMRRRTRPSGCM